MALVTLSASVGLALRVGTALAGGGPENVLVIIDPDDHDSLYLGNYYARARRIPAGNVIYLDQDAADYAALVNHQLEAVLGELSNRDIADHIDYVVLASGTVYRVSASGHVTEEDCTDLSRFSVGSAYMLAHLANEILAGDSEEGFGLTSTELNQYFSPTDSAIAFAGSVGWQGGDPSSAPGAPRYFIGAQLGYTGLRGNTPGEIVALIDRSVGADGTRPAGTFYYMKTTDEARSAPRDPFFAEAIDSIVALGGQAVQIEDVLPCGHHDCLGIMTGWANPPVSTADLTIPPGAFCDHLTSWAATFDKSSQTKVSAWIAKGAGGSHGTVEEPCAVAGKFPHPRLHVYYYQGLSLGESVLRSLGYLPYQGLIYGDPLTQPFAYLPAVEVPDAPAGVVSGVIELTPQASTAKPGAAIDSLDLFVDGVLKSTIDPGEVFFLDTVPLADGTHEVRIVAYDDSPAATSGRWVRRIKTDNFGRSVTLNVAPAVGDLSTLFTLQVASTSGAVSEIRVLQNDRLLAAAPNDTADLVVSGATLGGGPVRLIAHAEFADGRIACSDVATVGIDFGGACCRPDGACRQLSQGACAQLCGGSYLGDGTTCSPDPCPYCWTGDFDTNGSVDLADFAMLQECFAGPGLPPADDPPGRQAACLCAFDFDDDTDVDLVDYEGFFDRLTGPCPVAPNNAPVAYGYTKDIRGYDPSLVELPATDADGDALSYTVLTPPAQASVAGTGPTRVLRPDAFAAGTDILEFLVQDPHGASDLATVTLRYPTAPPAYFTGKVSTVGEPKAGIAYSPAALSGRTWQTAPFRAKFANDGSTLTLTAPDPQGVSPFVHWVADGEVLASGGPEVELPLDHNIIAVATYLSCRKLEVRANRPGVSVTLIPFDQNGQGGGPLPFDRIYITGTEGVLLVAPPLSEDGHALRYWKLDDAVQGAGQAALFIPEIDTPHRAVAIYADIPGDDNDDGDVDAEDVTTFQCCFSGDVSEPGFVPPSAECLNSFDLADPPDGDGDVDLADYAEFFDAFTGPF